jgi:hypothetical protein
VVNWPQAWGAFAVFLLLGPPACVASPMLPGTVACAQVESKKVLTLQHPATVVPLSRDFLRSSPTVLTVAVASVQNDALVPFSIRISLGLLTPQPGNQLQGDPILLGEIGVFPLNRAGSFLFSISKAMKEFSARENATTQDQLAVLLELRTAHHGVVPGNLEVTIGAIRWE